MEEEYYIESNYNKNNNNKTNKKKLSSIKMPNVWLEVEKTKQHYGGLLIGSDVILISDL